MVIELKKLSAKEFGSLVYIDKFFASTRNGDYVVQYKDEQDGKRHLGVMFCVVGDVLTSCESFSDKVIRELWRDGALYVQDLERAV